MWLATLRADGDPLEPVPPATGWSDCPPDAAGGEGWTHPASVRAVTGFVVPLLGLLVVLGYLPAVGWPP